MTSISYMALLFLIIVVVDCMLLSMNAMYLCHFTKKLKNNSETDENQQRVNKRSTKIENDKIFIAGVIRRVGKEDHLLCESSIISKYWTLTVSTCVDLISDHFDNNDKNIYISAGFVNWKNGYRHNIKEFQKYFNGKDAVAMIKVKNPFEYGTESPIKINRNALDVSKGLHVFGWSYYRSFQLSPSVKIIDKHNCEERLINYFGNRSTSTVSDTQFCINGCQFNIGSPIVSDGLLVGIAQKHNLRCSQALIPGVYVNVSKFVNWIDNVVVE